MEKENRLSMHDERDLSRNIFSVSAQLLGLCITVIGIVRATSVYSKMDTIADDALAANSLLFLFSCVFSYTALRQADSHRARSLERIADSIFIIGLLLMTANCFIVCYMVV